MTDPWLALVTLSLATFILTKLIVDLDFPPVLWLRDRVVGGWRPLTLAETDQLRGSIATGGTVAWKWQEFDGERHVWVERTPWIPLFFSELMSCPWCTAGWISAWAVAGTWLTVGLPLPVLMWTGSWSLGALLAQHDYA